MLTLLTYARYARSDRFSLGRYAAVLVFFALGLMCKPTLVTVPFVLLLLDYWPLGRWQGAKGKGQSAKWSVVRGLVAEKIPFFILSAASCVATILAQREAFAPIRAVPLQERLANAVLAYVKYVGQAIYLAHLAVLYPYPEGGLNVAGVVLALIFLLVVSVIFFLWRRSYPFALTGWFRFLGMLVPMIGIVQVGSQPMVDRYTYLPQIGLYILVTWGAMELLKSWQHKREVLTVAAVLIAGALITRSYFQTAYWQDSETLWRHTAAVTHDNYIAQTTLGVRCSRKGNLTTRSRITERLLK